MNWHAVYEIDASGEGTQFIPFIYMGLALLAVALILQWWARRRGQRSSVARFLLIGAVLVGVLGYGVNTWDQDRLARQLAAGEARVVEGPVVAHQIWREDVTKPRKDSTRRYHRWETITVGGVQFIWSPGAQEAAFTNAQTPAVDFHDGLQVRVAYVEDVPDQAHQRRILRLETADVGDGRVLPGAPFPSVAPVVVPSAQ